MISLVIKSSFNTLLGHREVMQTSGLVMIFADTWTEIHPIEGQAWFRYGTARSVVLAG